MIVTASCSTHSTSRNAGGSIRNDIKIVADQRSNSHSCSIDFHANPEAVAQSDGPGHARQGRAIHDRIAKARGTPYRWPARKAHHAEPTLARPVECEDLMTRQTLIKLIAAVIMVAFGIIVSLNWYNIAEGEPGWIGWVVIILSPVLYPAMAWMLLQRFMPGK